MMSCQSDRVRKYILEQLESGDLAAGSKIPGSRELSQFLHISRPTVQNALDSLVNEGILQSFQRKGLFVDADWRSRRISKTLHIFTDLRILPWMHFFHAEVSRRFPQLHITAKSKEGAYEILTTAIAQSQRDDYMDLMPLLDQCYPDRKPFFAEQLQTFQRDGRLFALPFLFSPRIMVCNKAMLEEASCDIPSPDWRWEDFIHIIRKLRKHFSPNQIFTWNTNYYLWMNFILSAGGSLFDPVAEDQVKIDSEATLLGLHRFCEIRDEILGKQGGVLHISEFDRRTTALSLIDRQIFGTHGEDQFHRFAFVPMPKIENCRRYSIQATELFAIRKGSIDQELAAGIIHFLWSEQFQDKLAELKYGIPIRKSSAKKTFSANCEADVVFREECNNMQVDYHLPSRPLFELSVKGISRILSEGKDLDAEIFRLAETVRNFIRFTR